MLRTVVTFLPILISLFLYQTLIKTDYLKEVKSLYAYQTTKCRSIGTTAKDTPSIEDFRFISDDIILFGSSQILYFVAVGDSVMPHGKIFAMNLKTEKMKEIILDGFPKDKEFRPHGLDYSKRTNILYVVNHANKGEERVDMFKVSYPTSIDTVTLKHLGVIKPPAGLAINSVTEASERDVYVSNWLSTPVPQDGTGQLPPIKHPFSLEGSIPILLGLPPMTVGRTTILHCNTETKLCEKGFGGFLMINGITSSPDGKLIFANDLAQKALVVLKRNEKDGKLSLKKVFPMPHTVDNVVFGRLLGDDRYELWFGSIVDMYNYISGAVFHDGRPNPGGLLVGLYNDQEVTMSFQDVSIHDGKLLHSVATGARYNGKSLISGPGPHGGLLVCELE